MTRLWMLKLMLTTATSLVAQVGTVDSVRRRSWVTCYSHAPSAPEIAACSRQWLQTRNDSAWAESQYPGLPAAYLRAGLLAGRRVPDAAAKRPDGPFGLYMGMTQAQLSQLDRSLTPDKTNYGWFHVAVPRPSIRFFEDYAVAAPQGTGLCKIVAAGKTVETSVYGSELRDEFDAIVAGITTKYGQPDDKTDYLKEGSIWGEPQDWMMGLKLKERELRTVWRSRSTLPNYIADISVTAAATSANRGFVILVYEFDNVDACYAELRAKSSAPF